MKEIIQKVRIGFLFLSVIYGEVSDMIYWAGGNFLLSKLCRHIQLVSRVAVYLFHFTFLLAQSLRFNE